jgi:hypothetical protein
VPQGIGRTREALLRTSKNSITIDQLKLACRHVEEMRAAGVTENLAIRTLELFADVYGQFYSAGTTTPHHVRKIKPELWSIKAAKLRKSDPDAAGKLLRVEHGTPRRAFARKILTLYLQNKLNEKTMAGLVCRDYRLAVVTLEEDQRLNKIARSAALDSPEERWAKSRHYVSPLIG